MFQLGPGADAFTAAEIGITGKFGQAGAFQGPFKTFTRGDAQGHPFCRIVIFEFEFLVDAGEEFYPDGNHLCHEA